MPGPLLLTERANSSPGSLRWVRNPSSSIPSIAVSWSEFRKRHYDPADFLQMAEALVPSKGDKEESFWANATRAVLAAVIESAAHFVPESGPWLTCSGSRAPAVASKSFWGVVQRPPTYGRTSEGTPRLKRT